ncbi:MAG: hypothetical protein QF614_07605, partial [SAR324 cluster bacterium]|nr:hypothetical protein [SAR324 cluster bacterium]
MSNPLTIPEGGLSVDGAGTLQVYDALQLNGTLAVTDSTLILEGVAVELGADLMVGGSGSLTTDSTTELSLLDNATLSAPGLLVLQSLDVESHTLTLDNVTGLTVQDSFNLSGSAGLRSDRADLTFHGVVSVNNTGFQREGGDLTLNAGGSFVQGLNLDNTTLELGGDLALSGEVRTNIGTVLSLGGNSLSFNSVSLQTDGPLDLSGTSIDNQTTLHLRGDTPLTHDAPFVLNSLELAGHTLTLQSATTGLTVLQALTLGNATDRLVKNEADLILAQPLTLAQGQLISTGGVLRLAQGAVLEDSTELDLTATTLEFAGRLQLDNATVTTTDATLKLLDFASLSRQGEVSVSRLELGEYGLELLSADNGSSSERTHLLISEPLVVAPGSASELGQQGIDTGSQSLT